MAGDPVRRSGRGTRIFDGKDGRRIGDRHALVARWVQAYIEGLRPKLKERRLQLRADGKQDIWQRLRAVMAEQAQPWAITGADAAELLLPRVLNHAAN